MSSQLDQALDDIVKSNRGASGRRGGKARRGGGNRRSERTQAPVGGIQKTTKPQGRGPKNAPTGPKANGEYKISISNLPEDVDEKQIKEYISRLVGHVKKVIVTYGRNGQSLGMCTVWFTKAEAAAAAANELHGVKVDEKPMKVEVMVSAKDAPVALPAKSLADRVSQPKQAKEKPKPATATKGAGSRGRGSKRARGGRNNTRLPKKTAEELDAEMMDYFGTAPTNGDGDANMDNGGAVQAATGGDTGMDEML